MPDSLKSAATKRRGRPPKASKLASKATPKPPVTPTPLATTPTPTPTTAQIRQDSSKLAIPTVPGLMDFTPDKIEAELPKYDDSKFKVDDALNPSESIPQITKEQSERNTSIYEGGIRAVKSYGLAFDLTKERFITSRKKVGAIGAGVKLATEIRKVQGDYIDFLSIGEANNQKLIGLGVAQHKTITDTQKAQYDMQTLDEGLEQSRLKAEDAATKTLEAANKLTEFQKQLSSAK